MNLFRPILISLSPNTKKDDIWLAFKLVFKPWKWKKGKEIERLEKEFREYLDVKHAISFNSGRSAFLALLKSLNLKQGDEVLLQAFTCNAAVNPIFWAGLKPVYVECNEKTLNIDIEDLKRKITHSTGSWQAPKSRAVVVQHTFGLPANMDEVLKICKENNLILIEDCAHSLGAKYRDKKVGTFGKAAFFSFGRDKIISSVYVILPLYGFFELGRWVLLFFQKTKVLSKAVHKKEKQGRQPSYIPKKMPNALAILALNQFKKLEKIISHQKEIAKLYDESLKDKRFTLPQESSGRIYMRYPVLIEGYETDEILKKARKKKIFLDDGWRKTPIVPPDTDQEKMGYIFGSCPKAEKVAKTILNLPTHINISKKQAQKIRDFLKTYGGSRNKK